jgi:hypothetical protein
MNNARQGGVPTALVFETSEPQGNDDRAPGWLKSVVADCVDHRKPMVIRTGKHLVSRAPVRTWDHWWRFFAAL